jgi:hypothetical protein
VVPLVEKPLLLNLLAGLLVPGQGLLGAQQRQGVSLTLLF